MKIQRQQQGRVCHWAWLELLIPQNPPPENTIPQQGRTSHNAASYESIGAIFIKATTIHAYIFKLVYEVNLFPYGISIQLSFCYHLLYFSTKLHLQCFIHYFYRYCKIYFVFVGSSGAGDTEGCEPSEVGVEN